MELAKINIIKQGNTISGEIYVFNFNLKVLWNAILRK